MSNKKERNHYDLKEMENIKKNAKIVSIAWQHNVLTEMFTITEKSALLYEKFKFLTSPNPSIMASWSAANLWQIKSRERLFFKKKMYSPLDI